MFAETECLDARAIRTARSKVAIFWANIGQVMRLMKAESRTRDVHNKMEEMTWFGLRDGISFIYE